MIHHHNAADKPHKEQDTEANPQYPVRFYELNDGFSFYMSNETVNFTLAVLFRNSLIVLTEVI